MIGFICYYFIFGSKNKNTEDIVVEKHSTDLVDEKKKNDEYKVDIKGEILLPGIYSLDSNSRVIDVIEKAGGLTENADTSVLNLSKKISDEMVIIIYSKEQVKDFYNTKELEKKINNKCINVDDVSLKNDACIDSKNSVSNNKISINNSTLEELMSIPGIGEAKAKEIISYRDSNGLFNSIEDLKNVPGIGDSLFDKIKENITL